MSPYETGILTPEKHAPLVNDLARLCERAGIGGHNQRFVWTPVKAILKDQEIEYIRHFEFHVLDAKPKYGIVYKSKSGAEYASGVQDRMMAMVGCLMRNFVDARIMSLDLVLSHVLKGYPLEARCLCIPNFFVALEADGMMPYKKAAVHDLLLSRRSAGLQTIVYVDRSDRLAPLYGESVKAALSPSNFIHVEV